VFTQPEPWAHAAPSFEGSGASVHVVGAMDHAEVRAASEGVEAGRPVFGVGGGAVVDQAKHAAWANGSPLVLVPTILSVDAPFTREVGVREDGRVRYVGKVVPEHLLVDFDLIRTAPKLLNRAGVGDLVSIHTALWDWERGARHREGDVYEPTVAEGSRQILERLYAGAAELRDVSDDGLRLLGDLFVEEVRLCDIVGSSRPEEGSEHHLAYCLEERTRWSYLHGQLVCLCVLLAGALQGQDLSELAGFFRTIELDVSPEATGTNDEELIGAMVAAPAYVRSEEQLLPAVFHLREAVSEGEARETVARVRTWLAG